MRAVLMLLALLTLAGCGVDGSPTPPEITVSGEARIGVSGTL